MKRKKYKEQNEIKKKKKDDFLYCPFVTGGRMAIIEEAKNMK